MLLTVIVVSIVIVVKLQYTLCETGALVQTIVKLDKRMIITVANKIVMHKSPRVMRKLMDNFAVFGDFGVRLKRSEFKRIPKTDKNYVVCIVYKMFPFYFSPFTDK